MGLTIPQSQAIDFSGADLLVSAAAGSGKTSTLVKRIVEKIKNGADVSRMLIVTFTNAAAAELRTRLASALEEALSDNKATARIGEQIIKTGNADICTIDAFCMKLARANFDKLGVDADFRIGEQSEIDILSREAMEDVIDAFYEAEEQDEDFLTVCDCFGHIKRENELTDNLLSLHKKLISTMEGTELLLKNNTFDGDFTDTPYGKILLHHIESRMEYRKKRHSLLIAECNKDEKTKNGYVPALCADMELMDKIISWTKGCSYSQLRSNLASVEFEKIGTVRGECSVDTRKIQKKRNAFKDAVSELNKWLAADHSEVKAAYEQNGRMCRAIYKILKAFEGELTRKKKIYSVCDFNDVERYALDILYNKDGTVSNTALEYREKYDEVYIDEYQDTNSIQDKIFSAISNNNRFMVGDIKQSIYKFRSAEPEIFSGYRTSFTPIQQYKEGDLGAGIFMSDNFRSDKGVIDFANLVSDYVFKSSCGIPYGDEDHLIYSKELPADYPHEGAEVYVIRGKHDEMTGENPEAELVARKIKALLDNGRLPTGEKIKPSDIAILLRTRTALDSYTDALKKYGVYYEYKNEESFYKKSEILLVLCLLNVIDSPMRDVYLAGALRSFVFGFSLEELVRIRQSAIRLGSLYASCKAYDKEDETAEKLRVFFEKTEKYRAECRKLPAHQVITMLYADTGILGLCTPSERKSLIRLYEIARRYEGSSYKGIGAFLRYVDKISDEDIPELVGDGSERCIKIATVHGSKGLEYPVCFLCDTARGFNLQDLRKSILFDRHLGVSGHIFKRGGIVRYNTLMRRCASIAIANGIYEEEMRKLYVALTRAKNKIIVTGLNTDPAKFLLEMKEEAECPSEYSLLNSGGALDWIVSACSQKNDIFDLTVIDGEEDVASVTENGGEVSVNYDEAEVERIQKELKERFEYVYPYGHINDIPSKISVSKLSPTVLDGTENEEVDQNISLDIMPAFLTDGKKQVSGADIGTATHLFMQFCDFGSLEVNGAEAELERLCNEGYISSSVRNLVNVKYVEAFAASELFEDFKRAKRILREFRFNIMLPASEFSQEGRLDNELVLVQGVTDCIYETQEGELVLVDYKTDSVTPENYRSVLVSRHKNQLTYYKKACEMMLERPVSRVMLYSVPLARSVDITGETEQSKED